MPHPCPHHCPRSGGGGAAALVVLVVLVVIAAAVARPVVHAVSVVLEVALIAAASLLGLAGIGGVAFLALGARRSHARARQEVSWHTPRQLGTVQRLSAPRRLAIEAPRPSLADLQALAAEHGCDVVVRRKPED